MCVPNPSKNKNHVHRNLKGIPDNDGYGSLPIVYGGVLIRATPKPVGNIALMATVFPFCIAVDCERFSALRADKLVPSNRLWRCAMTEGQKVQIANLRGEGYGYVRIAQALGISEKDLIEVIRLADEPEVGGSEKCAFPCSEHQHPSFHRPLHGRWAHY